MNNIATPVSTDVTVRWMVRRDLGRALEIEQQSTTPLWGCEDFLAVFQSSDTVAHVAESGDQIVGFLVYTSVLQMAGNEKPEPLRSKAGDLDQATTKDQEVAEIELLNLAVLPQWRRRGVGVAMLNKLHRKLRKSPACVRACVPETNLAGQLFLASAGYRAVSVLREYYGSEDAYLMKWRHG